jgi:hypothetical protein
VRMKMTVQKSNSLPFRTARPGLAYIVGLLPPQSEDEIKTFNSSQTVSNKIPQISNINCRAQQVRVVISSPQASTQTPRQPPSFFGLAAGEKGKKLLEGRPGRWQDRLSSQLDLREENIPPLTFILPRSCRNEQTLQHRPPSLCSSTLFIRTSIRLV